MVRHNYRHVMWNVERGGNTNTNDDELMPMSMLGGEAMPPPADFNAVIVAPVGQGGF